MNYKERVEELEQEGLTTSDAQAVADVELAKQIQWYEAKTGNHQGLIVDEKTGDNIAVVYDKKYVPFIVTACNAHDELVKVAYLLLDELTDQWDSSVSKEMAIKIVKNALSKAEGK